MSKEYLLKSLKQLPFSLFILLFLASCKEDPVIEETGLPPVADFSASQVQAEVNQQVQFTDKSTNNPTNWAWSLGEGPGRAQQHPAQSYTVPGWYTISLTVSNRYGSGTKTMASYIKVGQLDSIKDIEGNAYLTVKIGKQWWMAENLKSTKYNDGTTIPQVTDSSAWAASTTPAFCWYDNDPSYRNIYGALYNWHAVHTGKLAPAGWHVPTDDEWKQLEMNLGMTQAQADAVGFRGSNQGQQIKKTSGWPKYDNGTNTSGFSAIPGGYRLPDNTAAAGTFLYKGLLAGWWTSSAVNGVLPWYRSVFNNPGLIIDRSGYDKTAGFSIRCVKD